MSLRVMTSFIDSHYNKEKGHYINDMTIFYSTKFRFQNFCKKGSSNLKKNYLKFKNLRT